jgi:hypothetical protein
MDGYRHGLKGPLLDYAMKKYKSHRKFPFADNAALIEEVTAEYQKKKPVIKQERLYENVVVIE